MQVDTADLIDLVRLYSNEFDAATVFDGYATDLQNPKGVKILLLLNEALAEFIKAGINVCDFEFAVEADRREYLFDQDILTVRNSWLYDESVNQWSDFPEVDERYLDDAYGPNWRKRRKLRPTSYHTIGTRAVGIDCVPSQSDRYKMTFRAETDLKELVLATDVPGQILNDAGAVVLDASGKPKSVIPVVYQRALSYYPAYIINTNKGNSEQAQRYLDMHNNAIKEIKELANGRSVMNRTQITVTRSRRASNRYGGIYRTL